MKKTTVIGVAALLSLSSSVFANEFVDEAGAEFIFNADISGFDSGTAVAFKASKKMEDVVEGFSVEGELTKSLSGPSLSETYWGSSFNTEVSYFTLAAFGKYTHEVNDKISLHARGGLGFTSWEATWSGSGVSASDSGTDIGISYGFGGAYAYSDTMSVTASYSVYDVDTESVSHIGVGASMLF